LALLRGAILRSWPRWTVAAPGANRFVDVETSLDWTA
jgi:hypothetical protein